MSSDSSDGECAAAIVLAIIMKRKKKRKVRIHSKRCKDWLLQELEFNSMMNKDTFEELLSKVEHRIVKQDTLMRAAIPARHRLSLTLRFLASGICFEDLKFGTGIAPQTIGKIVIETCSAITSELKDFIKLPETQNDWKEEAKRFNNHWNFPHCLGAIGGKHINITQPSGSGSMYFNYKRKFSIILMAIVNSNSEILMVDVGTNGRACAAEVFNDMKFFSLLQSKTLNIPDPETLPGTEETVPFVFVADDAFPLMENIMKPFSHNTQNTQEIIFNYRLSRVHRIVENVFGILSTRFGILQNTIKLVPEKAALITLTCCYLHNYLRSKNDSSYFDPPNVDCNIETFEDHNTDQNLCSLQVCNAKNLTDVAKNVRNKYSNYFNTVGKVPGQNNIK